MQAVLALAFLALARAAIIEVPKTIINDARFKNTLIDPLWTTNMFEKYGLVKPMFDDMMTWGKSIGVEDPWTLNSMRGLYEKPALVFFQDPTGKIISYYAHEGIDKTSFYPEMRSAFTNLYDSSDKLAIKFHPEHMLGHYKHDLPGHFFEPVNNVELSRYINDMPTTLDHVTFKPNNMMKNYWNKVDIDSLPMIYKNPVALDIDRKYLSDAVMPISHVSPYTGFSGFSDFSAGVPFGKSGIISGASHLMPFEGFRSALGATPAVKSPAFHLVKADMPYFTAAPASGFVDSATGIPLAKSGLFTAAPAYGFVDSATGIPLAKSGLFTAAPASGFVDSATGIPLAKSGLFTAAPASSFVDSATGIPLAKSGLFTAAPASGFVDSATGIPLAKSGLFTAASGSHFIAPASAHAVSPFARAVPCVGCLGAEHAFAPSVHAGAGVIPLVKTFGDAGLSHFAGAGDFRSAFPGMFAEPTATFGASPVTFGAAPMTFGASPILKAAPATSALFVDPSVGMTGFSSGFAASPIAGWGKFF